MKRAEVVPGLSRLQLSRLWCLKLRALAVQRSTPETPHGPAHGPSQRAPRQTCVHDTRPPRPAVTGDAGYSQTILSEVEVQ